MKSLKKLLLICVMCVLTICLCAACGSKEETATVSTDGSTSMSKVMGALGEDFMNKHDNITFTYNPTGSGTGIKAVQDGRCDIGLSSRALKDSELAAGLQATILAYDGIAIIVNPDNSVSDLNLEQLAAIYTGAVTSWAELGGADSQIVLIGREAGSGTRDGFESITGTEGLCAYRQELTSNGDVITAVASNPNAIGYASLSALKDSVQAVSINGVLPSEATIKDGTYAIQRPFILVTNSAVPLSEVAQTFLDYATSAEAESIIALSGVVAAN